MALKYNGTRQGLSLPGLIDIIFLLLVFAIVKLVGYDAGPKEIEKGTMSRTLLDGMPELTVYQANKVEDITTLTVQIENFVVENPPSTRRLILMKGSRANPVPYMAALRNAEENGRTWQLPDKATIARMPVSQLGALEPFGAIRDSLIADIQALYPHDDQSNTLEMRAIETTEFNLLDFVLSICASLDPRVPLLSICVLQEQGE